MKCTYTVFGAGYVGMSLSVLLSQTYEVTLLEIDVHKIDLINSRQSHLDDAHIQKYLASKPLRLTAKLVDQEFEVATDYVIIAVPTNFCDVNEKFDTSIIEDIITKLDAAGCKSTIVIKSTLPLGFTDSLCCKYPNLEIIYSPEFLREGNALYDNLNPSRIIMGSKTPQSRKFAHNLLKLCNDHDTPVIFTNNATAEAVKLGSNAYLALRISFFNELDTLAYYSNIESKELINCISLDPRIGTGYNNPSFAYGGYCLPKDVKQLKSSAQELKLRLPLISTIDQANEARLSEFVDIILDKNPKSVGIFRLQMKKDSDNSREAANLKLANKLIDKGAVVQIYEPSLLEDQMLRDFIVPNLKRFLEDNTVIVANRWSTELNCVSNKVICRDIYNEN